MVKLWPMNRLASSYCISERAFQPCNVNAPTAKEAVVATLARQVRAGNRRALAKAITLVESHRDEDQFESSALIQTLLPYAGNALRIGLSGSPGVGKSTFIEAFGECLTAHGHRVAVLAAHPSSRWSGGATLGDHTVT